VGSHHRLFHFTLHHAFLVFGVTLDPTLHLLGTFPAIFQNLILAGNLPPPSLGLQSAVCNSRKCKQVQTARFPQQRQRNIRMQHTSYPVALLTPVLLHTTLQDEEIS
jgi:hypothetical protein